MFSGSGMEVSAFAVGYDAAEVRIKKLIRIYGEQATATLIKDTLKA